MTATDDREVIARIAAADRRADGRSHRWTTVAVALSAFLVVTVLGVGTAYVEASRSRGVAWEGMDVDAYVQGPTEAQIARAPGLDQVAVAGLRVGIGTLRAAGADPAGTGVDLAVSDDAHWVHQVLPALDAVDGTYPRGADELMLSDRALTELGVVHPRVGMRVDLDLTFRGAQEPTTRTFTVSGIYQDQTTKARAYAGSPLLAESGVTVTDKMSSFLYLSLEQPYLDAAAVRRLADDLGVDERTQVLHADDTGLRTLVTSAAAMLALVLLIAASGVLVVRSLLTIGLDRQIRSYGLIAAMGGTGKQLRRILGRQVRRIGILGTGLGIGAGLVVLTLVVPRVLGAATGTAVVVAPLHHGVVLVLAVLVSAGALAVSARGPLRAVVAATPIEAIRHLPAPVRAPRDPLGARRAVPRMALRALGRDRRRTVAVVSSFVLALTVTLAATALVASNDTARVLDQLMPDLELTDTREDPTDPAPLTPEVLAAIAGTPGVTSVRSITADPIALPLQPAVDEDYYTEFFDRLMYEPFTTVRDEMVAHPESFSGSLVGIDDTVLAELNRALDEPIDVADFHAGRAVVLSSWASMTDWPAGSVAGQDVTLRTPDGTEHRVRVTATTTAGPLLPTGISPDLVVSAEHAADLLGTAPTPHRVLIDYDASYDRDVEAAVRALVPEADVAVGSKLDTYDETSAGARRIGLLGLAVAGVLALVALVGFATTISAAVHARAREHALLEAVGATTGQLRRAVLLEGLGYWLAAAPLSWLLSVPVGAVAFHAVDGFGTAYTVPVLADLGVLAALAAVCLAVPVIALRGARRGPLTDRLR